MNLKDIFCPNPACPDRGKVGNGNISVHSRQEGRCICRTCGKTFSVTKGTALYGRKQAHDVFVVVTTLLAYGCPVVAAFGLDARTVAAWLRRAGQHCQGVHEHMIGRSGLDLGQVQADEIKVKTQRGYVWMAMALMVPCRLWLGGVVSARRDLTLIKALIAQVRGMALCRPLLILVDGLVSYVHTVQQAFRTPVHTGRRGRPRLVAWPAVAMAQVVRQRTAAGLYMVRRLVQGCPAMAATLLGHGVFNTAYIARITRCTRLRFTARWYGARRNCAVTRRLP